MFILKQLCKRLGFEICWFWHSIFGHPYFGVHRRAYEESVAYVLSDMSTAIALKNRKQVLKYAAKQAEETGVWIECGVYKGASLKRLAKYAPASVALHGFDSFEGLAEDWHGTFYASGSFRHQTPPSVPSNVTLHRGLFEAILPEWTRTNTGAKLALLHIDCDLYSAAHSALFALAPLLSKGSIIVLDEYFNYPGWQQHEFKAFQEFVKSFGVTYRYLAYGHEQAVIRIEAINHT